MSDQELEVVVFSVSYTHEEKELSKQLLALRAAAKRDVREEATLSIAKGANQLASEANSIARLQTTAAQRSARYAMWAALIAATAALIASSKQILALFGLEP